MKLLKIISEMKAKPHKVVLKRNIMGSGGRKIYDIPIDLSKENIEYDPYLSCIIENGFLKTFKITPKHFEIVLKIKQFFNSRNIPFSIIEDDWNKNTYVFKLPTQKIILFFLKTKFLK